MPAQGSIPDAVRGAGRVVLLLDDLQCAEPAAADPASAAARSAVALLTTARHLSRVRAT
ncbi:MAG: hypothetical protein QOH97_2517 [Actinoplanes sp.]|jgi:hypothetical protein|nr:hypothetical protein [Actinoplanes sp.]